jgi:hypothetical protein
MSTCIEKDIGEAAYEEEGVCPDEILEATLLRECETAFSVHRGWQS